MKKFMKAIAFMIAMCLVLSTVAFAAGSATVTDYAAKKVAINVEDVKKGEQVAIIVTKGEAADYDFTTETLLFIDQKAAPATTVAFEAEVTDDSVVTIDVYAGYDSNSTPNAVKVANDIPLTQDTKLTLVAAKVVDDVTAEDDYDEETMSTVDEGKKGSAVWMQLNATNVAAGDLTDMWWAFHVTKEGKADTKYAKGDVAGLGLGTVLTGEVQIAAAFDSTGYEVTGANAVFLLKGEDVHTATGDKLTEIQGDKVESKN